MTQRMIWYFTTYAQRELYKFAWLIAEIGTVLTKLEELIERILMTGFGPADGSNYDTRTMNSAHKVTGQRASNTRCDRVITEWWYLSLEQVPLD
jgi:hypothetical protein